jgi:hypothetical protein
VLIDEVYEWECGVSSYFDEYKKAAYAAFFLTLPTSC